VPADTVILAGTVEPDTTFADSQRDRVPELHAVGDCTGLGLILKAALEGARAACALRPTLHRSRARTGRAIDAKNHPRRKEEKAPSTGGTDDE
jgi:hypothetical protein